MTPRLLEWYNLIFELPLGIGLLYLALYTFSGWTFGDADADVSGFDHDVDAHLDVHGELAIDHDADLSQGIDAGGDTDAGVDTDADVDADADSDTDSSEAQGHGGHSSAVLSVLSWIGVGRMPISLVLMILLISWGTLGIASMQVLAEHRTESAIAIAIAIAGVGSVLVSRLVSSVLSRTIFATLNVARRRHELLGSRGEALYAIDEKFGMVCGRDDRGELFQVPCRIESGQPPLAKGAAVQLVAYTAREQIFLVVPAESSQTPRSAMSPKG